MGTTTNCSASRPGSRPFALARGLEPSAHALLECVPVAVLAAMAAKRGKLAIGGVGDVNRLHVQVSGGHGTQPDLGNRIGLETFDLEQLGMRGMGSGSPGYTAHSVASPAAR